MTAKEKLLSVLKSNRNILLLKFLIDVEDIVWETGSETMSYVRGRIKDIFISGSISNKKQLIIELRVEFALKYREYIKNHKLRSVTTYFKNEPGNAYYIYFSVREFREFLLNIEN